MKISDVFLIRLVLGVACCFTSLPSASAFQVTGSQVAKLSVNLTPKKDSHGQMQGLVISYTLKSQEIKSTSLALRFDTLEPALERTSDQVTHLQADDAHGKILFANPEREQQDGRTLQVWRSSRSVEGLLHVSYIVPVALAHPPKRGPQIDLQAAGGGLSGALVSVLLLPDLRGHIHAELVWHLPAGEQAVSTFAYGNCSVITTMNELENTLFLAGRLQRYPAEPPATGFSMYALGLAPGSLQHAAGWYKKAYAAMRQAFPSETPIAFRVLIRSYDGGPLDSGRANKGSLLLYLPPTIDPASPSEHSLIAHEIVHVFTRPLNGDPGGTGDWYTEGIADYLKITVPFAAGLYTRQEYLDLVNSEAALYYTNPDRGLSLKDAANVKWRGNVTWTIPYARGAMYFANLDAELKASGKSMIALANQMNRRIDKGEPDIDRTWLDLLASELGDNGPREWERMRNGQLLIPVAAAFGSSFESEKIETGFFSLGYSPAYHSAGSVIEHVDVGTNAASSGLRAGDSILETVDINPAAHSFNTPIQVRVQRSGKALSFVFDPHTKKQVSAWRWKEKLKP